MERVLCYCCEGSVHVCEREREPVVLWPNPTVSRPFFTLLLAMKGIEDPPPFFP